MVWIVLHPENGARLCKDHCWRDFACFGTYKECVKFYKRKGYAQRIANRYKVAGKTHIVSLSEGETMDASGRIQKVS